MREYLNEPNKLFRRVRDKDGVLRLSKAAAAYHPGRGVYRSSYKNALRLTATENNMAYRSADHAQWGGMDFVIGVEIGLSGNHPVADICDELKGVYPKEFKFTGWHPFCRCFATPKLPSREEMNKWARMSDKERAAYEFEGTVKELPKGFNDWMAKNAERIASAKSVPYFIGDNESVIYGAKFNGKYITSEEFEKLSKTMKITTDDKKVLYESDDLYIDSSWSRCINSELSKYKIGDIVPKDFMDKGSYEQIFNLDRVIYKNTIPYDMVVYRKVTPYWLKREGYIFEEGNIITEYGFTSTSAVQGSNVMRKSKNILLEIRVPKGTHAYITENFEESEIIFARNSRFKVVSVTNIGDNKKYILEIQGSNSSLKGSLEQKTVVAKNISAHKFGDLSNVVVMDRTQAEAVYIRPENIVNQLFSKQQIDNHNELAKFLGTKQGEQKEHYLADSGHVNPTNDDENCVFCSFVYELRRRGFNVKAKPYVFMGKDDIAYIAGETYEKGKCEGYGILFNGIKPTIASATKNRTVMQNLEESTRARGRYHLSWDWNEKAGHSAVVERFSDGSLMLYDGQKDGYRVIPEYFKNIKEIEVYRVDNATVNLNAAGRMVDVIRYKKKSKKR